MPKPEDEKRIYKNRCSYRVKVPKSQGHKQYFHSKWDAFKVARQYGETYILEIKPHRRTIPVPAFKKEGNY